MKDFSAGVCIGCVGAYVAQIPVNYGVVLVLIIVAAILLLAHDKKVSGF
jgi:hypothetical protein